jgi:ABC-type Na+ efflux pump permease subunit
MEKTTTNKTLSTIAWGVLVISLLSALLIGTTLETTTPDIELELIGETLEGDVIPDPNRWLYALGIAISGVLWASVLFAASEALTRLQRIEYCSSEHLNEYLARKNDRAAL